MLELASGGRRAGPRERRPGATSRDGRAVSVESVPDSLVCRAQGQHSTADAFRRVVRDRSRLVLVRGVARTGDGETEATFSVRLDLADLPARG